MTPHPTAGQPPRQPSGVPAGGQFAPQEHSEADLDRLDIAGDSEQVRGALADLATEAGATISADRLSELSSQVTFAIRRAHDLSATDVDTTRASDALGRPVRSVDEVLTKPLSPTEVALRIDEAGFVTAHVPVDSLGMFGALDHAELMTFGELGSASTITVTDVSSLKGPSVHRVVVDASLLVDRYGSDDEHEFWLASQYRQKLDGATATTG